MTTGPLTDAQHRAIAALTRSQEPVRSAIRFVLVDGLSATEAAARTGVDRQRLYNARARYMAAHRLIAEAYSA